MKNISQGHIAFLLFMSLLLSSYYLASARVLQQKVDPGVQDLKVMDTASNDDNMSNLMGLDESEGCESTEECINERKLVAEAHLDYIYTQKHRKP
ncbi:Phytosulfokines 5 [Bienertia sinuspersici]